MNDSIRCAVLTSTAIALLFSTPALAYVGPGLGAGTLAVIGGVIGSIVLAIFAIVWYPLKRIIRARKKETNFTATEQANPQSAESPSGDSANQEKHRSS